MLPSLLSLALLVASAPQEESAAADSLYRDSIAPLFEARCGKCHNPETNRGGLDLSRPGAVAAGGARGDLLAAEDEGPSLLWRALSYEEVELRMPPRGKLPEGELALIERWLEQGAALPEDANFDAHGSVAESDEFDAPQRASEHWSWQPLTAHHPPPVRAEEWLRDPLDRFVLADLEAANLSPSPAADRAALLRRLSVDLTGLLPTPEQVAAFEQDTTEDAIEKWVDSLLSTTAFAERWGRHWLDLMRYAETRGHEFDYPIANAWRYRDYVLSALHQDVPYDRFLAEHVAGDLLPEPRPHPQEGWNESPMGTAFWGLGEEVHSPVDIRGDELERLDDKIDVFGKAFLGLTVSCARCHDHKFDAISLDDYYALAGYLTSSRQHHLRFETHEREAELAAELQQLRAQTLAALDGQSSGLDLKAAAPIAPGSRALFDWGRTANLIQDGHAFFQRRQGSVDLAQNLGERLAFDAAVYEPLFDGLSITESQRESSGRDWDPAGRTLHSPSFVPESGEVHLLVRGAFDLFASIDSHRLVHGPLHQVTVMRQRRPQTEDGPGEDLPWRWVHLNLTDYVGERVHLELTPRRGSKVAMARAIEGAAPPPVVVSQPPVPEAWLEHPAVQAHRAERERRTPDFELTSKLIPALLDGDGFDQYVHLRGNPRTPGERAPRHLLEVLGGGEHAYAQRSGRLEVALELIDPELNPFVPRVAVNRVWHHLFGRGIVASPDDFGVLGERPSHPELLDHLALEFVADGWSLKRLVRRLVLSATYLQASDPRPAAAERDPNNQLLWRHSPRRLDAEALRDGLLLISGRLNPAFGGPSVPVHLTVFLEGRGRPGQSGPLDGEGRRSLYISVRRNFLDPFFSAFDFPSPSTAIGRRSVSNVPAQALAMLNSPLVNELCASTAERLLADYDDDAERLERLYLQTLARVPSDTERTQCGMFLESIDGDLNQRWTDLAHVLVNTKEFLFVR